ncbi:DUF92 domain-containing protein [Ktedonosporobacter rubrisoli]|uniref:DUF92 domain-containing protein n=1 Tax=Ktedonosporobacter rubrisoli TaxID=2509675 RepID=A0A4P6JXJ4_KTERU|nr:DUF92 domain-containing protein [Ktedonosporobacter rubrisoli]QBD79746.1 DUF92 domain-containing protein [Ktedonosporobacter rubrisoli]
MPKIRLVQGLLFSSVVGLLAYRRRSLSRSGLLGAMIAGTTTVGFGGWKWGLSLIFFFVSSSLFSHFRARDKEQLAADKFSKGSRRDIVQVAANGGVATLLALAYGATPETEQRRREALEASYVGSLAAATADTWATELGVLSTHAPRLITTGEQTEPGTSGGVTVMGSTAAATGAAALGLVFWLLGRADRAQRSLPFIALVSGLLGGFFDSWLGATVQATYYCPICKKETEREVHSCGTLTILRRGYPWMNNDTVNFLATFWGALVALALHLCLRRGKR